MNRIKGKKKSCESENPDFLGDLEKHPINWYFIPDISRALSRPSVWPLAPFADRPAAGTNGIAEAMGVRSFE
jgi:hypothetical protein